jgi:hypothetical protein
MKGTGRYSRILIASLLALTPSIAPAQAPATNNAIDMAQRQITAYLDKLADFHCTESVTQQKLTPNGHVEATERAKYDYLIMMNGSGDEFQLNESRIEAANARGKQTQLPMLVTNGVATVLLVFHPYYRDSFNFTELAEEPVNGRSAVPVHFTHIAGRRTPAALALRGREYPLELEGTAWLDKQSGEVVKVEATLLHDMSDVGLRSLHVHVEYKPSAPDKNIGVLDLPALAVVDVETPRQHWRNTHVFDNYRGFSTDAEQDPNVKLHASNDPDPNTTPVTAPVLASTREKR